MTSRHSHTSFSCSPEDEGLNEWLTSSEAEGSNKTTMWSDISVEVQDSKMALLQLQVVVNDPLQTFMSETGSLADQV